MISMYVAEERSKSFPVVGTPADVYALLKRFHRKSQEHFLALTLSGSHALIGIRIVSIGLLNRSLVHPREVFRWALKDNAVAVILAHNHPSGNTSPSPEDLDVTRKLTAAGEIMGIAVLDHIVFSKTGFYSFHEHGEITSR